MAAFLVACVTGLTAFTPPIAGESLEQILTGGDRLRWLVRETNYTPPPDCPLQGHYYTFVRDSALVIEEVCEAGQVARHAFPYRITQGSRGEQITFNEVTYEARSLTLSAPVCEGFKEGCVRLSSLVFGKMDRSRDLYLGR
jgi:hypothetical protein